MPESLEQMQVKRRQLDREIRAAKRAKAKAEAQALVSARQSLGVWLSESVGADTEEAVQRLKLALDSDQVRKHLAWQISTQRTDTSVPAVDDQAAESSDTSEGESVPPGPV